MDTLLNVKDFILETEAEEVERTEAAPSARKSEFSYSTVASNEMDIIIERKGKKSTAYLALIPSKGQFYVKKGGTVEALDEKNLTWFMSQLADQSYEIENDWIDVISKGTKFARALTRFIEQDADLIKAGLVKAAVRNRYPHLNIKYDVLVPVYRCNPKLAYHLKKVQQAAGSGVLIGSHKYRKYNPFTAGSFDKNTHSGELDYLVGIESRYGIDQARNWIDAFAERDLNFSCGDYYIGQLWSNFSRYGNGGEIDIAALRDYLTNFQREGFQRLADMVNILADDWKMQGELAGKIKDRYPENLATHHNRLAVKMDYLQEELDKQRFTEYYDRQKVYAWENEDYVVVVPESVDDMIDEATQQSNCLRSYIGRVLDGLTTIFFLRKKEAPDESLVTIEVKDGAIVQAKAHLNNNPGFKEHEAMREWADARGLLLNV